MPTRVEVVFKVLGHGAKGLLFWLLLVQPSQKKSRTNQEGGVNSSAGALFPAIKFPIADFGEPSSELLTNVVQYIRMNG